MNYANAVLAERDAWERFASHISYSDGAALAASRESWLENLITRQEFDAIRRHFRRRRGVAEMFFVRWVDSIKALHIAAHERAHVSDRDVPTGA